MIDDRIPHVGQVVDFFPSDIERFPAMVVQVFPADETRPKVNLMVFTPDCEMQGYTEVEPVDVESNMAAAGDFELEGRWAFAHELPLNTEGEEHDESCELGTKTNIHVGEVSLQ